MIRAVLDWLYAHRSGLKQALRLTLAGTVAFAVTKLFALPQGLWAAVTAVIVMQGSVGASLKAAVDRFWGTLVGAFYGMTVAVLLPHASLTEILVATAIALFPTALLAALYPVFRIAPVTALIILLPSAVPSAEPFISAFDRIAEITLGNLIGLATALLVLPSTAYSLTFDAARQILELEARLLEIIMSGITRPDSVAVELQKTHTLARDALKKAEVAAEEAARERRSHILYRPDLDPLIRSLRRLRSDLAMLGRLTDTPLPVEIVQALSAPLAAIHETGRALLLDIAAALTADAPPPDGAPLAKAIDDFRLVVVGMKSAPADRQPPGELYAAEFALLQFQKDITDLLDRVTELKPAAAS
jgi:uncharacterized membrane protein YccC